MKIFLSFLVINLFIRDCNASSSDKKSTGVKSAATVKGASSVSSTAQSRNLKKIIQELEESDYGSFGSWGNFVTRKNPRKQPLGKADENPEFQIVNIDDGGNHDENALACKLADLFCSKIPYLIFIHYSVQTRSLCPAFVRGNK